MSHMLFDIDRPTIMPEVPARWFAKGGAGKRQPEHDLPGKITHWGIGSNWGTEILRPESPLSREVLNVRRPHPADILLGVEVLSPRTQALVDDSFCHCEPEPFDWFYNAA